MLICCDLCRDTLDVVLYDRDPPLHGWTKQKPRFAPGLAEWRCPECRDAAEKRRALAAEEAENQRDVSGVDLTAWGRADRAAVVAKSVKARDSRGWLESFHAGYRRGPVGARARKGTDDLPGLRRPTLHASSRAIPR